MVKLVVHLELIYLNVIFQAGEFFSSAHRSAADQQRETESQQAGEVH
jgi:V-type H+-transporting ATPase subunit a